VRKYWGRICGEAWHDALRALALDSFERAMFRIVAAIIGVAIVWWATKGGTTSDLIFRIIGTLVIIALLPVVFLWKLILIPPKLHADAQCALDALKLERHNKEQRTAVCRALGQFIASGQPILVECSNIGKPVPNEWASCWEAEVLKFIKENLDPIYYSRFRNWSDIPKENFGLNSQPHEDLWQGMRARLARLHEYIKVLQSAP
jgi:hypothetical protein